MMRRFFKVLGADWDQFKNLLFVSIRIDLRGHQGMGAERRKLPPIFRSLIFYTVMSLTLAVSLVSRTTPFLFSFLTISYSTVMMAFAVVLELGNTIVNPDDVDVLAFRPISSRTYFLAKLCNLLFYTFLMGTALCLLPSLLGIAVKGAGWFFPLVFFPVAIIANIASASFILFIYTGLLKVMPYQRFKDVLAYLQMGFSFIILFSYQLIPRLSREYLEQSLDIAESWLYFMPSAWYAGFVQILLGQNRGIDNGLALIAIFMTFFLITVSFRRISLDYTNMILDLQTESGSSKKEKNPVKKRESRGNANQWMSKRLGPSEIKTGFQLTVNMMKNDRNVKMGIYPIVGMPLALLVLAIIDKSVVDPFISGPISGNGNISFMVPFFIFFMIHFALMGMTYSREYEAAWLYYVAPIVSPGRFYLGVKLAILIRIILPFFVILGIIYTTQIMLIHAIQHTVFLLLFGLVGFSIVSLMLKDFPFSRKREKGDRSQRFAFLFFIAPFFTLILGIQYVAYRHDLIWGITLAGLLIFLYYWNH